MKLKKLDDNLKSNKNSGFDKKLATEFLSNRHIRKMYPLRPGFWIIQ